MVGAQRWGRRADWLVAVGLVLGAGCDRQGEGTSESGTSQSGTSQSGTSQAMEPAPEAAPGLRPRWLLRDKDGEAVKAMVEPHCGDDPEDCRVPDMGAAPEFRCVHVTVFEDRYVGMLYGLADGSPLACHAAPLEEMGNTCWSQDDCSGPKFRAGPEAFGSARPDTERTIYRKGDELFYVSSEQPPQEVECFYAHPTMGCYHFEGGPQKVFPIVPVPDEMMELLAAGAPYTIEVVYD
ncbi:MAG: hypothetical protein JNL82_22380 [Myxococcales bacterium]|nr:hypothetical protein [Myxococcales bacterium]